MGNVLEMFSVQSTVVAPNDAFARTLFATKCGHGANWTVEVLHSIGHPFDRVLEVPLVSPASDIADVIVH